MPKKKYREYAYLTSDSFRIPVQAMNVHQGYSRAVKEGRKHGKEVIPVYTTYGRIGIDTGWRGVPKKKSR